MFALLSRAYGFDAQTGELRHMMSKGIIDPTKVVRGALTEAVRASEKRTVTIGVLARDGPSAPVGNTFY
jgi:chaperonin GroEL (HSP60 family)